MEKRAETTPASHCETRQRLLEAAGEVFAEVGFKAATVRDICQRAGANVAAVNYHFGDKEKLYAEVLRYASLCAREKYEEHAAPDSRLSAEQRLGAFVRAFLARVFDEERAGWRGKLVAREMIDPTPALDYLVEHDIGPMQGVLGGIVRDIVGPAVDSEPRLLRRCVNSVLGQCLFYNHVRPVLERLYPGEKPDIEGLAKYVTAFSLAGLREIARQHASSNGAGEEGRK